MQLNKIVLDNFRCFKHLELVFHTNHQSETLEKTGGMTVLVAANGQGKTAVLEAVKYLLGSFISRFPKTSVPRLRDSDYRDEWSRREGFFESQFVRKPRAPYLRLWGEAEFSHAGDVTIQWDLFMKRDKTSRTSAQLPTFTGNERTAYINEIALGLQGNVKQIQESCDGCQAYTKAELQIVPELIVRKSSVNFDNQKQEVPYGEKKFYTH